MLGIEELGISRSCDIPWYHQTPGIANPDHCFLCIVYGHISHMESGLLAGWCQLPLTRLRLDLDRLVWNRTGKSPDSIGTETIGSSEIFRFDRD